MSMEDALEDADVADAAGEFCYQGIADNHSVERSTLSRKYRGVTRSMEDKAINSSYSLLRSG
jgi:hypothetical protein